MITAIGESETQRFSMFVVRRAIITYLNYGIQVNRGYTPGNMRRFVSRLTGKHYKRSRNGLKLALQHLEAILNESIH